MPLIGQADVVDDARDRSGGMIVRIFCSTSSTSAVVSSIRVPVGART